MKRLYTIALFAGVFAVAMGAISLNGISATPLMTTTIPQTVELVGMYGHVEYTLRGADQYVKSYIQSDNIVVDDGKDCVSQLVFETGAAVGGCTAAPAEFQFIAIGNNTGGAPDGAETELDTSSPGNCATGAITGEMARRQVTPTFAAANQATPIGTVVTLDTSTNAFTFGPTNSTTTILQSGVFDRVEATTTANGECLTLDANQNMFSIQELNGATGITVNDGDSLSVKWTITVG